jgi:hypothetical protein
LIIIFKTVNQKKETERKIDSMMVKLSLLLCSLLLTTTEAFVPTGVHSSRSIGWGISRQQTARSAVSYNDIQAIGYPASVARPLGVIFGENPAPYSGLVVDDVALGLNGGAAGLKIGDQLLSINGQVMIGSDFESTMDILRDAETLDLMLFRGPAKLLYQILQNQDTQPDEDEEDEDEGTMFDENYESPVTVPVDDDEDFGPLTPGDVLNAFKKVTSGLGGEKKGGDKKKGGFFSGMFSDESIQLDGDDANTMK